MTRRLRMFCHAAPSLLFGAVLAVPLGSQQLPDSPQPQQSTQSPFSLPRQPSPPPRPAPSSNQTRVDLPWPRETTIDNQKITVYQPQLESWDGDELKAYAAVSVLSGKGDKPTYGVIWFNARTEVDKVNRQVTLNNFQLTKVTFPTMPEQDSKYQEILQAKVPTSTKVIALDRLEAELATIDAEQKD